MQKEFVPRKTITVQLTMEVLQKFNDVCKALDLTKTKTVEQLITEAYDDIFTKHRV